MYRNEIDHLQLCWAVNIHVHTLKPLGKTDGFNTWMFDTAEQYN